MKKIIILTIFIILLTSFASAVDTANNELYYSYDYDDLDISANNPLDISSNGNDATTSGATFTSSGILSGAYIFDGSNDYMNSGDIDITGTDISISSWVKMDRLGNVEYIVTKGYGGSNVPFSLATDGSNHFTFSFHDGTWHQLFGTSTYTTGVWYHVVGTYDGTTLRIYVDGEEDGTLAYTGTIPQNNAPVIVGAYYNNALPPIGFADITIDETSLWSKTLSESEILELYNEGNANNFYRPELTLTNIYSDSFSTDTWTDVGGESHIYVDTGNSRMNVLLDRKDTAQTEYSYKSIDGDLTNNFEFNYTWNQVSYSQYTLGLICLSDTIGNYVTVTGGNSICFQKHGSVNGYRFGNFVDLTYSDETTLTNGINYLISIKYEGYENIMVSIYNGATEVMTDNIPIGNLNISALDYMIVTNYAESNANYANTNYLDNLILSEFVGETLTTSYFDITLTNLNTFSVLINGTILNTTNGTVTTTYDEANAELVNFTIYADNYFNITKTNYNSSTDYSSTIDKYQRIRLQNKWNSSYLQEFTVEVSSTNYTTTNDELYIGLTGGVGTITYYAPNYISRELTFQIFNVNDTNTDDLWQSEIDFACYEKVSTSTISCNSTIYPNEGTYNFTISSEGYNNIIIEETINALDARIINVNGFYYANLTLVNNFVNGPTTNNCLYYMNGIDETGYSETINDSWVGLINGSYNILADCENYAYNNINVSVENLTQSATFDLYTTNTIDITIYDETFGTLITQNTTVTKILGAEQSENVTSSGTISYQYLDAGNYTFTFESDEYPRRDYEVEIGEKTYQTLDVYLLANSSTNVIFTFYDQQENVIIEDATTTIKKYINNTETLISVLQSDITGRIRFNYDPGERYCFSTYLAYYELKEWCLDPVIFSSYNIWMIPTTTHNDTSDFADMSLTWMHKTFYNDENNTVGFTFASPTGSFQKYGFNATYNSTIISVSGNNAYGEQISDDLLILDATVIDEVVINYYYKTTDGVEKSFKQVYGIVGTATSENTFIHNKDNTYGLGLFERALILVLISLFVGGAAAMFSGIPAAGVMILLIHGYFVNIGFIDFWLVGISDIMLFIIVAWVSSR